VLVVGFDVALVLWLPRDWTAFALGVGTTIGLTVAGGWLAWSLHRSVGSSALHGAGRALAGGLGAAVVAAAVGLGVAALLPTVGAGPSIAVTAVVAVVTLAAFVGVAALLDRPTVRLLLRRRVVDG
jgi:hypothetical protein